MKINHLLQPWEELDKLDQPSSRMIIKRAEGIYLYDEHDRKLIDGPGGMWCMQLGYGRQEIAQAMSDQAMTLTYNTPWYTTNSPALSLAERIASKTPGDLNRVFFTSGGSTAVDSALRFVQLYNNQLGRTHKKLILSRPSAYHGSTYLSASCSGKSRSNTDFDYDPRAIIALDDPSTSKRPADMSEAQFCDQLIDQFQMTLDKFGGENIAAYIAEPVLASGGLIIPPQDYHQRCLALCRQHDILYISDEVVTAFGRLGHWFSSESVFGIVPDIITFAKGVTSGYAPLGGFALSERLLQTLNEHDNESSIYANGYTNSGHAVCCAAAHASMDIIEREHILEHVNRLAPIFHGALNSLKTELLVSDIRSIGLMACVECDLPKQSDSTYVDEQGGLGKLVDQRCQALGLFLRPLGNACVMSPALVIKEDDISEIVQIIRTALRQVAQDLGLF